MQQKIAKGGDELPARNTSTGRSGQVVTKAAPASLLLLLRGFWLVPGVSGCSVFLQPLLAAAPAGKGHAWLLLPTAGAAQADLIKIPLPLLLGLLLLRLLLAALCRQ